MILSILAALLRTVARQLNCCGSAATTVAGKTFALWRNVTMTVAYQTTWTEAPNKHQTPSQTSSSLCSAPLN